MNRKTIRNLAIIVLLLIGAAAIYAYKEYNRKQKDITDAATAYKITSEALLKEFAAGEKNANTKYLDKALKITGRVKGIDRDEKGNYTVVLGDSTSMSSVRCSIDSLHSSEAAMLFRGDSVLVKGFCTGFTSDELLGSDVILNRCTVLK